MTDEEFRERIFTPHRAQVQQYFAMLGYSAADRDEATFEVFQIVWEAYGHFNSHAGALGAWVHGITRNVARDRLRKKNTLKRRMLMLVNPFSRETEDGGLPFYLDAASGAFAPDLVPEITALLRALDALDEVARMVIVGRYVDGQTLDEVARDLKMHRSRVKRVEDKALQSLRTSLDGGNSHATRG